MCNVIITLFLLVASVGVFDMHAAVIGSDTDPVRFSTQQNASNGDRVARFTALEGGLKIDQVGSVVTFDSMFPVSGVVDLGGGILTLDSDLIIRDSATLASLGTIIGNGHTVSFSPRLNFEPMLNQQVFNCGITQLLIENQAADVLACAWSHNDEYIAVTTDVSGSTQELRVYSFNSAVPSLTLLDSVEMADNTYAVDWHPTQNWLAVARDAINGQEVLIYSFDGVSLTQLDSLEISSDAQAVAWHPSGNYLAIGTKNNNNELSVHEVNGVGVLGSSTVINITPNEDVQREAMGWDPSGNYLLIGTTNGSADELQVYTFTQAPLALTVNASVNTGAVGAVAWNPVYPQYVAVGLTGSAFRLRIYEHNPVAGTLTQVIAEATNLANAIRILDWSPDGRCLALGKNNGAAGGELRTYEFDAEVPGLTLVSDVNLGTLVEAARWSHSGSFLAIGSNANQVRIYVRNSDIVEIEGCYLFDNVNLVLNNDVILKNCCIQFTGNSMIDGRCDTLTLDDTSTLSLGSNATLLLSDITINGLDNNRFYAVDNTSTFSLSNTTFVLDNDYSFTSGRLEIYDTCAIEGQNKTFFYRTSEAMTIHANSSLAIHKEVRWYYDPPGNVQDLIQLRDATSVLSLNTALLHATAVGLSLAKGTVAINGHCVFTNDGATPAEGIIFGDGIMAGNDVTIRVGAESGIDVQSGFFRVNNVHG